MTSLAFRQAISRMSSVLDNIMIYESVQARRGIDILLVTEDHPPLTIDS